MTDSLTAATTDITSTTSTNDSNRVDLGALT